jgi:hypothetical protein
MTNDSRPVNLLSDSKGIYGIGILYDNLIDEETRCYKHLIFRPDVIAESAFPIKNREALLHTLPKQYFILSHEWTLHEIMLAEALKRNPRYQEREQEVEAGQEEGGGWWTGDRAKLYRKIRWGQHKRQLINLNGMLKRLISEAAEPNALKLARRFHPIVRENIYRGQQSVNVHCNLLMRFLCWAWLSTARRIVGGIEPLVLLRWSNVAPD